MASGNPRKETTRRIFLRREVKDFATAGEYLSEGRNGHGVRPRGQTKKANIGKGTRFCCWRPVGADDSGGTKQ